jgi:hypothetical protein
MTPVLASAAYRVDDRQAQRAVMKETKSRRQIDQALFTPNSHATRAAVLHPHRNMVRSDPQGPRARTTS